MKTRNLVFVFAMVFLALIVAGSVSVSAQPMNSTNYTTISSSNLPQVQSIKYTPYPANPGEYFNIWIQAQIPTGDNYARFELLQDFPFSVDNSSQSSYTYTNDGGRSVLMQFKVRVSQDAVEGVNELKLETYTSAVQTSGAVNNFDIYISNAQTDFDLVVQDSSSSQVSLAIANIGENTANSMIVRIPEQTGFRITGTNGQMVGNLDSGDYSIASFDILPTGRDSNVLEVEIDYTDSIGVRRTVYKNVTFFQGSTGSFNASASGTGMPSGARTFNRSSGNFGPGNFASTTQSTSVFKKFWFWLLVIIVAGGGFYLYKNPEKRKELISKFNKVTAKRAEKDLKKIPEWVSSERKKKR